MELLGQSCRAEGAERGPTGRPRGRDAWRADVALWTTLPGIAASCPGREKCEKRRRGAVLLRAGCIAVVAVASAALALVGQGLFDSTKAVLQTSSAVGKEQASKHCHHGRFKSDSYTTYLYFAFGLHVGGGVTYGLPV